MDEAGRAGEGEIMKGLALLSVEFRFYQVDDGESLGDCIDGNHVN